MLFLIFFDFCKEMTTADMSWRWLFHAMRSFGRQWTFSVLSESSVKSTVWRLTGKWNFLKRLILWPRWNSTAGQSSGIIAAGRISDDWRVFCWRTCTNLNIYLNKINARNRNEWLRFDGIMPFRRAAGRRISSRGLASTTRRCPDTTGRSCGCLCRSSPQVSSRVSGRAWLNRLHSADRGQGGR